MVTTQRLWTAKQLAVFVASTFDLKSPTDEQILKATDSVIEQPKPKIPSNVTVAQHVVSKPVVTPVVTTVSSDDVASKVVSGLTPLFSQLLEALKNK